MKRLLLAGLVVLLGTVGAMAQNSIIGKWKVASVNAEGMTIDLEKPENTKKLLAAQFAKESGKEADSATINQMYTMFTTVFQGMSIEFTKSGMGIFTMSNPRESGVKTDTARYTVDYAKGIMNTVSKEEGKEKHEQMNIKFEGEYLVMAKEEGETIRLKRSKE
jgi:hypothetical protein